MAKKGKIVVCDDEELIRWSLTEHLRSEGYEVFEAENGVACLEVVARVHPSLLLLDLRMPELDGLALLRTLRAHRIMIPFGFVTAQGSPEMREKARLAGANFLISKPFTAETFAEVLGPMIKAA